MGYITNAIGLRLNLNDRGWATKFVGSAHLQMFLFQLRIFLKQRFFSARLQRRGFIYSNALIKFYSDRLEIGLFLYDGRLEDYLIRIKHLYRRSFFKLSKRYNYLKPSRLQRRIYRNASWPLRKKLKKTRQPALAMKLENLRKRKFFFDRRRRTFVRVLRSVIFNRLRAVSLFRHARQLVYKLKHNFGFSKVKVRFLSVSSGSSLNTNVIANYIVRKLYYKYRLMEVLNPLIKGLAGYFVGLRIDCAGRFTRAQRASFSSIQKGRVPLNSFRYPIEYTHSTIPLKYGMCSIKVWICYPTRKMPFYYFRRKYRKV